MAWKMAEPSNDFAVISIFDESYLLRPKRHKPISLVPRGTNLQLFEFKSNSCVYDGGSATATADRS
ncbi:hypothetical protein RchiOBHm_Chr7g0186511 [Rosa chinensis]|uniref:Uncharacterized protein n=1 Tax=Rosa chinensis TaxID=74649 RepID=A0A2P6P404_ROSCH|nr:hypothetical protein RchiOBHm_Chr7g0186511 [Rosa chinensis]